MLKLVDTFSGELGKTEKILNECSPILVTLGDEARQRILLIIAQAGENGISVQDITGKMLLSRPAVSHHLKILKTAGMVASRKKGAQVRYFICIGDTLAKLEALLSSVKKIVKDIDMEKLKSRSPWMVAK